MYTSEQIRAAGISGEINSIDVEHLISLLKEDENNLWMEVAETIVGYNIGKKNTSTKHSLNNRIDILKCKFSITRNYKKIKPNE